MSFPATICAETGQKTWHFGGISYFFVKLPQLRRNTAVINVPNLSRRKNTWLARSGLVMPDRCC